jgi:hypothetical protein
MQTRTIRFTPAALDKLRDARNFMAEDPRRVQMNSWMRPADEVMFPEEAPSCGTVGCIAGWLSTVHAKDKALDGISPMDSAHRAAALLDLPIAYVQPMFHVVSWPRLWHDLYLQAQGHIARACVVIWFLDHILATGRLEGVSDGLFYLSPNSYETIAATDLRLDAQLQAAEEQTPELEPVLV